ncbi:MAG: PEP-CTERM sorting domain-containing protein [Planctomycetia bacterium]|nr:PEP-CTERM sorting domain-containing protein [Planctomycetia bacterium]
MTTQNRHILPPPPQNAQINILRFFAGAVFSLVTLVASPLLADDTYTWNGSGTVDAPADWFDGANWTGGTAPGYTGTVMIDDGHAKFNKSTDVAVLLGSGTLTVGGVEGKTASLKINGSGNVYLGNSDSTGSDSVTMKLLTDGTFYSSASFWVGCDNSNIEAHLVINGGSAGTSDKRLTNLVLRCKNANNSIVLNSGWIYAEQFWLSGSDTESTFNMTGGTLDISKLFQIGRDSSKPIVNVSGGTLKIDTLQLQHWNGVDDNRGGGTLNIIGNKSDWTVGTLSEGISGKLNFIAGHVNEDGSVEFSASDSLDENGNVLPAFSTINVSGTATLKGTLSVDMPANYFYGDVVYLTGDLTQTLISTTGGLIINDATLKVTGTDGWKLDASDGKNLVLTPDNMNGWVELNMTEFTMDYKNGLGTAETFVDWLNTSGEIQGNVTVTAMNADTIKFSNYVLADSNVGHLYLDYSAYNSYHHEAFPEPATWAMLVIGVGVLVLGRRKR